MFLTESPAPVVALQTHLQMTKTKLGTEVVSFPIFYTKSYTNVKTKTQTEGSLAISLQNRIQTQSCFAIRSTENQVAYRITPLFLHIKFYTELETMLPTKTCVLVLYFQP